MPAQHVVLTHEHADFDAIASLHAAARLYPWYTPVLPRQINRNVEAFITLYRDELGLVRQTNRARKPIRNVLLVDTQTLPTVRGLQDDTEVSVIDHHTPSDDLPSDWQFRGRPTGACTTLLTEDLREEQVPLTPIEATFLLLGIYEDTGSLTYACTTADDLQAAAWLVEQGARLNIIRGYLHHPLSPEQQELFEQVVAHAEFHNLSGHTIALSLVRAGSYVGEISTLAHRMRDLYEPAALFLAVQMDSHVQIVARSATPAIDVGHITRHLGGGGHPRAAAAFRDEQPLDELRQQILGLLATHVQPAATIARIMSRGNVRTLAPETTIREADDLMRRWGHEGFPVVERGRVIGILRRPDVDKALHHGLGDEPVSKFMRKGPITISPHDSVQELQEVMTNFRVGQVPVVEEGRVVGIVTRTDLLKLWTSEPPTPRADQIAYLLEKVLSPTLLELVREIGNQASEMGYSLYFVGGFVRDLLLWQQSNRPRPMPGLRTRIGERLMAGDIDLVVEGDAITLARRLSSLYGGRVRSHARFGTAKWFLEGTRFADAIPFIDLVTARTEFYESPSALPNVERSSIRQDLHRRDFTINTLAICLDEGRYGHLLDFYGGEQDLQNGLIRVLHSLSFVEDPTRILRAIRMEQRFSFRIEERTEELLRDSVNLLSRVSGSRLRNELYAIFRESQPGDCLARMQELGVLTAIHPALRYDAWLAERVAALPDRLAAWNALAGDMTDTPIEVSPAHYAALLTFRLRREEADEVARRLSLNRRDAALLAQVHALQDQVDELQRKEIAPSKVCRLLRRYETDVLMVVWAATDDELVCQRLEQYEKDLRWVTPHTDGHVLRALGVPPGPVYSQILNRVRDAVLDGEVTTPEEEEELVEQLVADGGSG